MKEATKEKSCELLSDEQIIDLYFAREERAIKETDHKYGKYLFTIAYNIVQDTLDCEECLNDTYLNTWNRIPPTRPSIFHAFLSKIMRNIAVDRYRHNKAQKRAPSEMLLTLEELDSCTPNEMSMDDSCKDFYQIRIYKRSDSLHVYFAFYHTNILSVIIAKIKKNIFLAIIPYIFFRFL